MATPSLAMIPSAYADSKVYSVLPNNGDGDFTFNRDSSATRVGSNGLIQTVGFFGNDLVTNGSFDTDSDWTKGGGWSISGGKAKALGVSGGYLLQNINFTNAKTYKIQFDISDYISGEIRIRFSGGSGFVSTVYVSGNNTHTLFLQSIGNTEFRFQGQNTFTASIDNVSVKEVTGDQPRLNYDISNGVVQSCPSLLLEPASTNLVPNSQDFSSGWTFDDSTITNNSAISPDGVLNASLWKGNTVSSRHNMAINPNLAASVTASFSLFVKSKELKYIQIASVNTTNQYVNFDASAGSIGTVGSSFSNAKIEDYGNGWYRCSVVSPNQYNGFYISLVSGLTATWLESWAMPNNTDGLYIFGTQVEALSYPTSYIPTNGSSQTRAAESCIKENLSSTILEPSYPFTMYAKLDIVTTNSGYAISLLNPLTYSQYFTMEYFSNLWHITSRPNNVSIRASSTTAPTIGTHKVLGIFTQSDMKLYLNGSLIASGTNNKAWNNSINALLLGQLRISSDTGSRNSIREAQFFKTELTNAQAITLTTL